MKKLSIILAMIMMLGISAMATGCGGSSSSSSSDYKPGNPQYDYDAWKYGIDHPGFYDD
jgi:hypothetical protein